MNSSSSISGAQACELDPLMWTPPPMLENHEVDSTQEALRWCGLNELLFALEVDGLVELSAEPFL